MLAKQETQGTLCRACFRAETDRVPAALTSSQDGGCDVLLSRLGQRRAAQTAGGRGRRGATEAGRRDQNSADRRREGGAGQDREGHCQRNGIPKVETLNRAPPWAGHIAACAVGSGTFVRITLPSATDRGISDPG